MGFPTGSLGFREVKRHTGVFRPTWEFYTHLIWRRHPLPMNGCKSGPMLGTYGHWGVSILYRATPTVHVTRVFVYNGHHAHTYCLEFGSGAVTTGTCFNDQGNRYYYPIALRQKKDPLKIAKSDSFCKNSTSFFFMQMIFEKNV